MAPKTAKKAIKDALASLSKKNFEIFCEELLEYGEERKVPRNKVEGENFLAVANVLVSTFTEAKAPGVVVELLREISCLDVADKLAAETSGQSSNPGSSDTASPSAGATGVNTMSAAGCSGEDFVDKHRAKLIDRVSNIEPILDELLDEGVISQGIYDQISALTTTRDKMRKLYSGPLYAAGHDGKEVFYKLLEKHDNCLIKDIKKNE